VVMTPKSLLRHPRCVSSLAELAEARFQEVLDDPQADPGKVRRVVLTAGKLFYDLLKAREEMRADHVALVRLEQFYPVPAAEIARVLARYPVDAELLWAQEEPQNMGAWRFVREQFLDNVVRDPGRRVPRYVGRAESAAPAPGSHKVHVQEQEALVRKALEPKAPSTATAPAAARSAS